jgi:hypothetical protein
LLQKHWQLVDETLGEDDAVYVVDESAFPKKGEHSVAVARQWCGVLGKVENCSPCAAWIRGGVFYCFPGACSAGGSSAAPLGVGCFK